MTINAYHIGSKKLRVTDKGTAAH